MKLCVRQYVHIVKNYIHLLFMLWFNIVDYYWKVFYLFYIKNYNSHNTILTNLPVQYIIVISAVSRRLVVLHLYVV